MAAGDTATMLSTGASGAGEGDIAAGGRWCWAMVEDTPIAK